MHDTQKSLWIRHKSKKWKDQVLVFRHKGIQEAGIQIPKGTVKEDEDPYNAVSREIKEETGINRFEVNKLIAEDFCENDDGVIHNRYFYKIVCDEMDDEWEHDPTGGGEEQGLTFQFFWLSSVEEVKLIRGHADYLKSVLNK